MNYVEFACQCLPYGIEQYPSPPFSCPSLSSSSLQLLFFSSSFPPSCPSSLFLFPYLSQGTLAEAVDKYYMGISPGHWLPWIPQLLTCLVRREGTHMLNLLCSVGKAYPQAVYFPIRTLYLTLKMEQREKCKVNRMLNLCIIPYLSKDSMKECDYVKWSSCMFDLTNFNPRRQCERINESGV